MRIIVDKQKPKISVMWNFKIVKQDAGTYNNTTVDNA